MKPAITKPGNVRFILRNAAHGQGVVEYAGALVVGTIIVGAVIVLGPYMTQETFGQVINNCASVLTSAF